MIPPAEAKEADREAALLDRTHPIPLVGYGPATNHRRSIQRGLEEFGPEDSPPFVKVERIEQ